MSKDSSVHFGSELSNKGMYEEGINVRMKGKDEIVEMPLNTPNITLNTNNHNVNHNNSMGVQIPQQSSSNVSKDNKWNEKQKEKDSNDQQWLYNLSLIDITKIFPETIQYPGQKMIPENINSNVKLPWTKGKLDTNIETILFDHSAIVYDVAFWGNILAAVGAEYFKVYNIETKQNVCTFKLPNENLYALSLTYRNNTALAAIGGQNIIIRIIDIINQKEVIQLIGHKNEVYDLKFHPTDNTFLLSASKDSSIRLWNINTGVQICIFGGPLGHIAEVWTIDWHESGEYFVSGGIDNSLKIWSIIPKIKAKMVDSHKEGEDARIKTWIKTSPCFSCNTVHDNYIDCVKFNGNFVISKSVDGILKEWLPWFNKEGDSYYLINSYSYDTKDKIWYVKYYFSKDKNIILVGNEIGFCFWYKIKDESGITENENNVADFVLDCKCDTIWRSITYSDEYSTCAIGTNKGEIILSKYIEEIIE